MKLHQAILIDKWVYFNFDIGETSVTVVIPYAKLKETVPDSGDLHSQVEKYVESMFNLTEIL